ncbi:MAG: alpha/beta hydrolase, partial [Thermoanaerobaculia bacterium]
MDARDVVLSPAPALSLLSGLRLAFRTISAVSPALAAKLAQRLWFTPPRPRVGPTSRAFLATGERLDVPNIAAWSWGSGPAVILVHGWGGYAAQLQSFVEPLTRAGYRAIAFDMPAHAESGPSPHGARRATLFDFADAFLAVA